MIKLLPHQSVPPNYTGWVTYSDGLEVYFENGNWMYYKQNGKLIK
jgi:hypothetical protein